MFARTVVIDDKEYLVFCSPNTPYSEVLQSAARQAEREEANALLNSPIFQEYEGAL